MSLITASSVADHVHNTGGVLVEGEMAVVHGAVLIVACSVSLHN